jgi:hypothetical protein
MPKRNKPELEPYEYLRFVVAAYQHDSALDHLDEPKQQDSMPKRKEPELDPKEQFKRFVETAHDHGVDESGKEFERAFKKIVPPKKHKKAAKTAT